MDEYTILDETRWENGNPKRKQVKYNNGAVVIKDYLESGVMWQFTTTNQKDEMHGTHSIFYPDGRIKIEEFYFNDTLIYQKTFNRFGQQLTLDEYESGEIARRTILMVGRIEFS